MYKNLVKETTTTTGTGAFVLGGAASGFRSFASAYAVGDDVPYCCRMGSQFEFGKGKKTATTIERGNVTDSSNGGALVSFAAGTKDLFVAVDAGFLNGAGVTDLPAVTSVPDSYVLEVVDPVTGGSFKATVAALKTVFGSGGGTSPSDTTAPTFPDALTSSNVTQASFTLGWSAASDANGISKYEYSFDGSSWTSAGTALSVNITGRTAATTYTMRARAVDPSGNTSTVRTLAVTTAAASGDTTNPTMTGSLTTASVTSSGYVMNWTAGSDNVGIVAYETSIDGGTTWLDVGTALTRTVSGRPASTTDNLRVRARDAAGLYSNVLSATVTTSAEAVVAYTITGQGSPSNAVKDTYDASALTANVGKKSIKTGLFTNGNTYISIAPTPASAVAGWSDSPTAPPAILADPTQNTTNAGGRINGAIPMTHPAAWSVESSLNVVAGSGSSRWYLWIKPVDGAWFLFNPSGVLVTGA